MSMEQFYQNMLSTINQHQKLKKIIIYMSQYLPYIIFIIYPCLITFLMVSHHSLLLEIIIKPMIAFVFVTLLRKIINRPRPFETMFITPLIHHDSGESFPSRHALSAMIIAFMFLKFNIYLGIFVLIIALIICLSRVLTGVHYISDILSAILIALIIALL